MWSVKTESRTKVAIVLPSVTWHRKPLVLLPRLMIVPRLAKIELTPGFPSARRSMPVTSPSMNERCTARFAEPRETRTRTAFASNVVRTSRSSRSSVAPPTTVDRRPYWALRLKCTSSIATSTGGPLASTVISTPMDACSSSIPRNRVAAPPTLPGTTSIRVRGSRGSTGAEMRVVSGFSSATTDTPQGTVSGNTSPVDSR